jgi:hypothetical protein
LTSKICSLFIESLYANTCRRRRPVLGIYTLCTIKRRIFTSKTVLQTNKTFKTYNIFIKSIKTFTKLRFSVLRDKVFSFYAAQTIFLTFTSKTVFIAFRTSFKNGIFIIAI